jgi:hypothetical protein
MVVHHAPCADGEASAAVVRLTATELGDGTVVASVGLDPNLPGQEAAKAMQDFLSSHGSTAWVLFADVVPKLVEQPAVVAAACGYSNMTIVDHHASNGVVIEALQEHWQLNRKGGDHGQCSVRWTASGSDSAVVMVQGVCTDIMVARKGSGDASFLRSEPGTAARIISDCDTTGAVHTLHAQAKTATPATLESWLKMSPREIGEVIAKAEVEQKEMHDRLLSRIHDALKVGRVVSGPGGLTTLVINGLTPMDMNLAKEEAKRLGYAGDVLALPLSDRVSLRPLTAGTSCLDWGAAAGLKGGGHPGAACFMYESLPALLATT